jgi:WD40 repeat protein/serine/threonine protein kinase
METTMSGLVPGVQPMSTNSSSVDREPLERLAAEFLDRRRRGENPSPSEYAERYPDLANQIREFFPALEVMEGLKPGASDQTHSIASQRKAAGSPQFEQLGEYRILREIGRGGMGVVYEAVQESLGRRVALKILPMHGRIDPVQMERFQLESRSAARLHHTGIVPVYGVGEHGGVHFYAMQYIQGHGLDVILDDLRGLRDGAASLPPSANGKAGAVDTGSMAVARSLLTGRFTGPGLDRGPGTVIATSTDGEAESSAPASGPSEGAASIGSVLSMSTETGYYRAVARLGIQVAGALAHAHGLGVLHRDIKPSNLLLDVDGHVWVTDFGLAKLEGSDGPTQTGDIIGTLRYMAPERFEGWSDRRSDLYGLGMTLYELLTLRPAFESVTRAKLIDQVIHDQPPPPRKRDPRVPRDLETIVMKAIAKEPADRYPTVEALAADLENYVADRPIVARRSGLPERAWRWCRRNPAGAGMLAAVSIALLALVGIAVGLVFLTKLRTAHAELESQRTKVEEALAREQRLGYYKNVSFAETQMNDDNPFRAALSLDECRPDRRNWEWYYLKRQCHTELLSFTAHPDPIWSLAVSPDGRLIATGGGDRTLRLWEAETGREVWAAGGYVHSVDSVAFSPDGTYIASADGLQFKPGHVRIHEVMTGKELSFPLTGDTGVAASVAFSADGSQIAIASGEIGSGAWVAVRELRTGLEVLKFPTGPEPARSASISPDGKSLMAVVGSYNDDNFSKPNEVRVWDTKTQKLRFPPLRGHTKPIMRAYFSPDGSKIATTSYDATVRIWDAANGRELWTLRGHRSCVNAASFSRDSRRIASASDDGSARIWDVETGQEQMKVHGHRGGISQVAFSRDGLRLITSGFDGAVKVWDATASPEAKNIVASDSAVLTTAFSPDGRVLLTAGADRMLKFWGVQSGKLLDTWRGHQETIWQTVFSPDRRYVASAAGDWNSKKPGEVFIWDRLTGERKHPLRAHSGIARCVAFSPDSRWLVSGGGEVRTPGQEIVVWDVATGERLRTIPGLKGGCAQVAFSPNGLRLAATTYDVIQTWDALTGKELLTMEGHHEAVWGLAYDPKDGRFVVSCGTDATVRIWDSSSGRTRRIFLAEKYMCRCVAVSPDGKRIASAGEDQTIKLWDMEFDQPLISLKGHHDDVRSVAFSPDGRLIASADAQGKVKIWDATPPAEPITANRSNSSENKPR